MRQQLSILTVMLTVGGGLFLLQCQQAEQAQGINPRQQESNVTRAVAHLQSAPDTDVRGTVTFEKTGDSVKVVAQVSGLTPGEHGFHIHEFGDCSVADFSSAGSHFAMADQPHGAPTDTASHTGDLGNLVADENGEATLEWVDPDITFSGARSILGRAVIIHAQADDLESQPTGNAGARVACGTIAVAQK